MQHELKTDTIPFKQVENGSKTFEIRKDDRGFAVGDVLQLRETRYSGQGMASGEPLEYTGRVCTVGVRHIMRGPIYGLADGWVVMSIRPTWNAAEDADARNEAGAAAYS
jgi:Domain of unknown function (DUF3850)